MALMHQISEHARCYELDGRNVLFNRASRRLFVLNRTGSQIWDRVASGEPCSAIVSDMAKATGVDREIIAKDVSTILASWQDRGFIGEPGSTSPQARVPAEKPSHRRRTRASSRIDTTSLESRAYQLIDYRFRLWFEPGMSGHCDFLLGHLELDTHDFDRLTEIHLIESNGKYRLLIDGNLVAACTGNNEIVPMLHANTLVAACKSSNALAVIHAAAVARGEKCVLLPAVSGTGKSTLTAALVSTGLTYCTDDVAVLSSNPTRLRPAPIRLGIKSGSWQVLEQHYPELAGLQTCKRADKKLVKYLLPPQEQLPSSRDSTYEVVGMIFPSYADGAKLELKVLDRADALFRMTNAGYDLPTGAGDEDISEIIDWLRGLDCYELSYSDLSAAAEAVDSVLDK